MSALPTTKKHNPGDLTSTDSDDLREIHLGSTMGGILECGNITLNWET